MRTEKEQAFAREIYDAALPLCNEPWKARWMTAIACLESQSRKSGKWGTAIPAPFNCIGYHWIEGMGWEHGGDKIEGGTGRQQKYRAFASYAACMESLLYLMDKSSIIGYRTARNAYAVLFARSSKEMAQRTWINGFSKAYCPSNAGYAGCIFSIIEELKPILGAK